MIQVCSCLTILADTRVNHTGVLAVSNYLGSSVAAAILTFVLNSLYGFNYEKINICSHFITSHIFNYAKFITSLAKGGYVFGGVGLSVCRQHYLKSCEQIGMKF